MTSITTATLSTRDPSEAERELRTMFPTIEVGTVDRTMFRARFASTVGPGFAFVDYDFPAAGASAGGSDDLVVVRGCGDDFEVRHGRADIDTSLPFLTPEEGLSATWRQHRAAAVVLDRACVDRVAASTVADPRARARQKGVAAIDPDRARFWDRTVASVRHLVAEFPDSLDSPLVARAAADQLAAAFLYTFPTLEAEDTGPSQASASAARRAVEVMRARAGDPISVADVAAATFISARGLHYSMTREFGMTPSAMLRRIRLEGARADLLAGHPHASVTDIARRWGFASPSRFEQAYRFAYGESPVDTLGR